MPLPLIIWGAIAAASAIAAAAAAAAYLGDYEDLKDGAMAILGANTTGKTTLATFLQNGTILKEYQATNVPDSLEVQREDIKDLKLESLKLKIRKVNDVPGSKYRYKSWQDAADDADIILYLLRVDQIMKDNKKYKLRIKKDVGQIEKWIKNKTFVIIGTHIDHFDSDFDNLKSPAKLSNKIANLEDKIHENYFFNEIVTLAGGRGKVKFLCGSLKTKISMQATVDRLLKEIQT